MAEILIKISKGNSKWFAECKHLDIFATGDTPMLAVEEFDRLVKHFSAYYAALPVENAGPFAQTLKHRFEEFG